MNIHNNSNGAVGILYRNNISSLILSLMLNKYKLNYVISEGMPNPLKNWMVKEVLETINKEEYEKRYFKPSPSKVLSKMLQSGFISRAREFCDITGQQKSYVDCWIDFIKELCYTSKDYNSCINKINDITNTTANPDHNESQIYLTTIHAAKGLEYDTVFIVDLVNGEFPGSGAMTGALLEEERRLFYVGLTRAKSRLYLLRPITRGDSNEDASIFFNEAQSQVRKSSIK
jgi:superfamily I DNA/RNA helicase